MLVKYYKRFESILSSRIDDVRYSVNFWDDIETAKKFIKNVEKLDVKKLNDNITSTEYASYEALLSSIRDMYNKMSISAKNNVSQNYHITINAFAKRLSKIGDLINSCNSLVGDMRELSQSLIKAYTQGVKKSQISSFESQVIVCERKFVANDSSMPSYIKNQLINYLQESKSYLNKIKDVWSDSFTGKGIRIYENGNKYDGEFKNGLKHGKGKLQYSEDKVYNGNWKQDKRDGYGVYTSKDFSYEGEWLENVYDGKGKLIFSQNKYYDGEWKAGLKHGKGKFQYDEDQSYYGDWKRDKRDGYGEYTSSDFSYEGEWADGAYDGIGIYACKKYVFKGRWKNGKRHGEGYQRTILGGKIIVGEWHEDLFNESGYFSIYIKALTLMGVMNSREYDRYCLLSKTRNNTYGKDVTGSQIIFDNKEIQSFVKTLKEEGVVLEARRDQMAIELFNKILNYRDSAILCDICKQRIEAEKDKQRKEKVGEIIKFSIVDLIFGLMPLLLNVIDFIHPLMFLIITGIIYSAIVYGEGRKTILGNHKFSGGVTATIATLCLMNVYENTISFQFAISVGIYFLSIMSFTLDAFWTDANWKEKFWFALDLIVLLSGPWVLSLLFNWLIPASNWHALWIFPVLIWIRALIGKGAYSIGVVDSGYKTFRSVYDVFFTIFAFILMIIKVVVWHGFSFGRLLFFVITLLAYIGNMIECAKLRDDNY